MNYEIDTAKELETTIEFTNILLSAEHRLNNREDTRPLESPIQIFGFKSLSKICEITEAYLRCQEVLLTQAMLTRAIIEVAADIREVHRSVDIENVTQLYLLTSFESYTKIHKEFNKWVLKGDLASGSWRNGRMFNKTHTGWSKRNSLTSRIVAFENNREAINFYDILSHFTHIGGTGSYTFVTKRMETLVYRIMNTYLMQSITMLFDFNVFTENEKQTIDRIISELIDENEILLADIKNTRQDLKWPSMEQN